MGQQKRENKVGIKKIVDWDLPLEPGTDDEIILTAFTPGGEGADMTPNDDEFGQGLVTSYQKGPNNSVTTNMELRHYFSNVTKVWAMAYGMYGSAASPGAEGTKHTFKLKEVIETIMSTIAWDERNETKAVGANVLSSLSLSNDNGFKLAAEFMGTTLSIAGAYSQPLGLTPESGSKDLAKLFQTDIYLNNFEDGAFTDADKLCANVFEPTLQRGFEVQEHCAGYVNIKRPEETAPPTFDTTLGFPKKDDKNKTYHGDFRNQQQKKMKVVMTGGFITTAENFSFTMYFPLLEIINDPVYDQESPLPVTPVNFGMKKALTLPTGFAHLVPYAELINDIAPLTGYPAIV